MKDTLIIGAAILVAIALGTWLLVSGGTSEATEEGAAEFSVLQEGDQAGSMTERKNYRIKSQEELGVLWSMIEEGEAPTTVDFSTHEVLAVFDGEHSTGGYDVTVQSVEDTGGTRVVTIVHTEPGESCMTTDAITSPFVLIILPKSDAPISREDIVTTTDCS